MALRRSPRIAAKQAAAASAAAALKEQRIARAAAYFGPIDPDWKIRCGAWIASDWEHEVIETYYLTLAEYLETGAMPSKGSFRVSPRNYGRYEAARCLKKVELEAELILLTKESRKLTCEIVNEALAGRTDSAYMRHLEHIYKCAMKRIDRIKLRAKRDYGFDL